MVGIDKLNFMVIGIDARMLGPEQGGIGRYIQQLIKRFNTETQQHLSSFNFVVFLRKTNWNLVSESLNIKKVLADIPWYGWREQIELPKIINKEKIDLMHFPHWNLPLFYNKPFVVTIHDLLLLHYPTRQASTLGPLAYFFKNFAYRFALKHAIKKSRHIITPSEFTKNDIIKTFNVPKEKISAIHLAPMDRPDSELRTPDAEKDILFKYDITKPYVLYVGVAYPHKNLEGLIAAWKIFCAEHGNAYQLVLVGKKNYFYNRLKLKTGQSDSIIFTNYVSDYELPALYQNASLYIFPSFYEGFGLPPLEAMQYGVPVASSNAGSMPEVLKSAALYFDPKNKGEMASAIWQGLINEDLRQILKKSSAQLIHNFSWEYTAKATSAVYKKML